MKALLSKFRKIKKAAIVIFLSSNLILLSTGSAEFNLASESANLTNQSTPSGQVDQISEAEDKIAPEVKIDPTGRFFEDELIVRFKDSISVQKREQILKKLDASILREDDRLKSVLLKLNSPESEKVAKAIEKLEKNPDVEYFGPSYVMKTQEGGGGGGGGSTVGCGEYFPNDYYFCASYQNYLNLLQIPAGWLTHKGSSSIAIAVLDTGVDYNHYDLGLAPSGRVVKGFDYWNQDSNPMDDYGHGTAVAGAAGAKTNNVSGIAGVDWYARIVAIKVSSSDGVSNPFIMAQGIYDAIDLSASYNKVIINISSSTPDNDLNLKNAIAAAVSHDNVYVVASVSNSPTTNCFMGFPAAYSGVISVAAVHATSFNFTSGCTGNVSGGTTYQKLQLVAPGNIFTLWKQSGIGFQPPPGSPESGATSMAAPLVSGVASILATCSNNIHSDLIQGAIDRGPAGWDSTYGYGSVDLKKALLQSCL